MKRNISSLILVFILLLFWQGAAMGINAAYILPSPTQILVRLWELREPLLLVHLPATMGVTALGLCISVVLGLLLAISMDWNPRLEKTLTLLSLHPRRFPQRPLRRCLSSGLATASGVRCL